jgi:hypothetical protein
VTSEFDFDRNKEAGLDFSFGKRKVVSRERECYVLDGGWRERERERKYGFSFGRWKLFRFGSRRESVMCWIVEALLVCSRKWIF